MPVDLAQYCLHGQLAGDALGSLVELQFSEDIRCRYPDGVRELGDGGNWNTIASITNTITAGEKLAVIQAGADRRYDPRRHLEFLNLLKGFIIEREKVEKKDLINAPFTVIHPQGIRGVFSPAEINEILQLTERLAA